MVATSSALKLLRQRKAHDGTVSLNMPERKETMEAPNKKKVPFKRSPNSPVRNLPTAIKDLREVYELILGQGNDPQTVQIDDATFFEAWRLSASGSGGHGRIAALKQYGLLEERKKRIVVLTELALKILNLNDQTPASIRDSLLQEAALKPKMYHRLWDELGQTAFNDEERLQKELLRLTFTPKAIPNVSRNYLQTIEFAKLVDSGTSAHRTDISIVQGTKMDTQELVLPEPEQDQKPIQQQKQSGSLIAIEQATVSLTFSKGRTVTVTLKEGDVLEDLLFTILSKRGTDRFDG